MATLCDLPGRRKVRHEGLPHTIGSKEIEEVTVRNPQCPTDWSGPWRIRLVQKVKNVPVGCVMRMDTWVHLKLMAHLPGELDNDNDH